MNTPAPNSIRSPMYSILVHPCRINSILSNRFLLFAVHGNNSKFVGRERERDPFVSLDRDSIRFQMPYANMFPKSNNAIIAQGNLKHSFDLACLISL